MLVSFSFLDVLRIPEFSGLNQFDLLQHKYDSQVAPFIFKLGGDVDKGLRIQACKHRTLDLKAVVGYRYVCLERNDEEWLKNRNCSMSARIHSQPDRELRNDMVRMSAEGMGESGFRAMCAANGGKEGTTRSVKKDEVPEWQEDLAVMRSLRDIQKDVRGFLHVDEDILGDDSVMEAATNFETQTKGDY